MVDLVKKHVLGKVIAHINVIKFQKRGLPHAHILLILDDADKPRGCHDYDTIASAEIPDIDLYPAADSTVVKCMLHYKCGVHNPQAPGMVDEKCS
jgi:hypothetical protein